MFQFDWNVTRNENVADIGALQISYKTWHTLTNGKDRSLPGLEGLRASQLFFISAAQVNKQTGRHISSRLAAFFSFEFLLFPTLSNTRVSRYFKFYVPFVRVQFSVTRRLTWLFARKRISRFSFCVYAVRYPSVRMHSHFEFRCIFTAIFFLLFFSFLLLYRKSIFVTEGIFFDF